MKLILIRHGESARNAGVYVSGEENSLTIKGVKQAVHLGEELAETHIDTIYCSHAARCEQTMDEILRNRDDEIAIHFTRLVEPKTKKEELTKLKARAELFIDDLQYDHEETETVVVISHLMPLQMMTYLLTGKKKLFENGEKLEVNIKRKTINEQR